MKYYIIAGEASGDLHGSNLVKELKKKDPSAMIRCWGGDLMQAAGATVVKHYRDLAFMGFVEVLKNIGTILRNLSFAKKDIVEFKPDVLILIDYPGFNLRICKWAKEKGLKVIYYISPQVWAWKEGRVAMMKKCIDKMIVILPFEERYFREKWDWEVEYVGHPLVSIIDEHRQRSSTFENKYPGKKIVALLPGSRKQEILKKLPVMLEVTQLFPNIHFIVAQAPAVEDEFYKKLLAGYSNVSVVQNKTYDLLSNASAALVTSGTATLETALFEVPEVVCYKGSPVSYAIAKKVIKVKYIALVNLILNRPAVKELIQDEMNVKNLGEELNALLNDQVRIEKIKQDYSELRKLLRQEENASAKAAESIYRFLRK